MQFARGLRLAQGIAERTSTMPMLANVLRTPGQEECRIAASWCNSPRNPYSVRVAGIEQEPGIGGSRKTRRTGVHKRSRTNSILQVGREVGGNVSEQETADAIAAGSQLVVSAS